VPKVTEITVSDERSSEHEGSDPRRGLRCAIYTRQNRKVEPDRDGNSRKAQREAAEALIASRQAEGWTVLPDRYDDRGSSEANAGRPALERLLSDIEEGGIDCVVVYRLDRLARSMVGLARIIEALEAHGVEFVSIAPQFDTTRPATGSPVGVLLSFARFARELMAGRATRNTWQVRRRGKRVGGVPMLGYTLHPREHRLIVHDEEAEQVRTIFELYLEKRAMNFVVEELNQRGWCNRRHAPKRGRPCGERPLDEQAICRLLRHPVYIGKVDCDGERVPGKQEAIVDEELWTRAQQLRQENRARGTKYYQNKYGAVLRGLLHCEVCGGLMWHQTWAAGSGGRYYLCADDRHRLKKTCPTRSVPALAIETTVIKCLRWLLELSPATAEAVRQARERCGARIRKLEQERSALLDELRRLEEDMSTLGESIILLGETSTQAPSTLKARMRRTEERMRRLRSGLVPSHRELVDARTTRRALSVFGPEWDSLGPVERWIAFSLLVERVGYNGRTREIVVRFRSAAMPTALEARTTLQASHCEQGRQVRRRRTP